jgi:hypothetical protein
LCTAIDLVHFGAVLLLNLEIGMITPPFAANLCVGLPIWEHIDGSSHKALITLFPGADSSSDDHYLCSIHLVIFSPSPSEVSRGKNGTALEKEGEK